MEKKWKWQFILDKSHALRKWALKHDHMRLFRVADKVANYMFYRRYGGARG